MAFLSILAASKSKPAILSLVEPYSSQYVPKSLDSNFLCVCLRFSNPNLNLNYSELLAIASDYQFTVTEQQAMEVESKTKQQVNFRLWFQMCAGRIKLLVVRVLVEPTEAVEDTSFCLEKCDSSSNEVYRLKRDHSYYYQVSHML